MNDLLISGGAGECRHGDIHHPLLGLRTEGRRILYAQPPGSKRCRHGVVSYAQLRWRCMVNIKKNT